MKKAAIFILFHVISSCTIAQTSPSVGEQNIRIPFVMFDINYSNNYLFFNSPTATKTENGDIALKLNNAFELNFMGLFVRNFKSKRNKLYGGLGVNVSDYSVNRKLYSDETTSGHFPMAYSYNPGILNYSLQTLRLQLHLDHYAFYKRLMLFQKLGIAYTAFLKNQNSSVTYEEKYGNSYPKTDPEYITPDNPEGWHWIDSYTTTKKNDLDLYRNGISVFYNFGIGVRIKQITPFAGFEFSYLSSKFRSPFLKVQLGVNYAFLKK